MQPPEPLQARHSVEGFDCGSEPLNLWLKRRALSNQLAGVSRTTVLCEGNTVIAFVTDPDGYKIELIERPAMAG